MKKIVIFFNAGAGFIDHFSEVKKYVARLPLGVYDIEILKDVQEIEIVATQLAPSCNTIVAAGGDGTVNAVASAIIKSGAHVNLGIVPLGTFNHFAKDAGIPLDLHASLDAAITGKNVLTVDAASCNDQVFLNNSSIGLYAKIIHIKERHVRKGIPKWVAHTIACLQVALNVPKILVSLDVDGGKTTLNTSLVFVGNNAYDPDASLGERSSLTEGMLSVWVAHKTSLLGFVELIFHAFRGKLAEHKDFDTYKTREMTVETGRQKPISVALNGEATKMTPPLVYKILPKAINIQVQ